MVTQLPTNSGSIPKELYNSAKSIHVTRIKKLLKPFHLYEAACEISNKNDDGSLYISKFQIYKHCRNSINKPNDVLNKVDDSKFVSFSRLKLPKELDCYLFSLISSDIFDFDENGEFVCSHC